MSLASHADVLIHTCAHTPTGGKSLSSPSTNVEITDPALTMLAPNVRARGQVLQYKAAKERAWAEAERRWRDAGEVEVEEEEGN